MQSTGRTGGNQARLTPCGTRWVVTTGTEWGVAQRFVSGVDFNKLKSTNPSVDVQSVPSLIAASNHRNAGIQFINEEDQTQKHPALDYLGSPCKGLGVTVLRVAEMAAADG